MSSRGTRITVQQFCELMNVSKVAVTKAIQAGRLSESVHRDGRFILLDADLAKEEWENNTDYAQKRVKGDGAEPTNPVTKKYLQNRMVREHYASQLARLEYMEKSGQVVSKEAVKKSLFEVGRIFRDAILSIPDRLDADLAASNDQLEVNEKLKRELNRCLEQLSDGLSKWN